MMIQSGRFGGGAPPFSPLDLASLKLWLKADAGTFQTSGGAAAVADGDQVGEWQDQSGNGIHLSQATSSARPTLKLSIMPSGLGVVRGDGVDDFLEMVGLGLVWATTQATLAILWRPNGALQYGMLNFGVGNSFTRWSGDGFGYVGTFRTPRTTASPLAQPTTGAHVHTITSGPTNGWNYRRNGAVDAALSESWFLSNDLRLFWEDNSGFGPVDIAEVVLCDAELTGTNLTNLESYLAGRGGI